MTAKGEIIINLFNSPGSNCINIAITIHASSTPNHSAGSFMLTVNDDRKPSATSA